MIFHSLRILYNQLSCTLRCHECAFWTDLLVTQIQRCAGIVVEDVAGQNGKDHFVRQGNIRVMKVGGLEVFKTLLYRLSHLT